MKSTHPLAFPRLLVLCAAVPLIFASLTGCATHSTSPPPEPNPGATNSESDIPNFPGAWASDFEGSYRQARSDFERIILEDGVITDAEFAEMEAALTACLNSHRIEFQGYQQDGTYDYQSPPSADLATVHEEVNSCMKVSGARTISTLYFAMIRNPQNRDEGEIMSACLVKGHAVAPGYSAEDYYRDAPTGAFPFVGDAPHDEILNECIEDPLGLTHDQSVPQETTAK